MVKCIQQIHCWDERCDCDRYYNTRLIARKRAIAILFSSFGLHLFVNQCFGWYCCFYHPNTNDSYSMNGIPMSKLHSLSDIILLWMEWLKKYIGESELQRNIICVQGQFVKESPSSSNCSEKWMENNLYTHIEASPSVASKFNSI